MGVDYTAVLAVGKEFENESEALDFLHSTGAMKEDEDDIDAWLPGSMNARSLDLYSGYGYYIGIDLRPSDVEGFRKNFEDAVAEWDAVFKGKADAEMIHTVRIH